MRITKNGLLAVGALAGVVTATGCGEDGADGTGCSVEETSDSALITCSDGSEVELFAGGTDSEDGDDGEAGDDGNAGAEGDPGMQGAPGTDGVDGTSCTLTDNGDGTATVSCPDGTEVTLGEAESGESDPGDYRASSALSQPASEQVWLADGLRAEYVTRHVADKADMFSFWPSEADATHLVFCIEGGSEDLGGGKLNPSVQTVSLVDRSVRTVLRGMERCDGVRTTAWGTVLATEEASDGSAYEILDVLDGHTYTITDRGAPGVLARIVDENDADASAAVAKRAELPTMAWEGLAVLESGVVLGGDELRPGSYEDENGSSDTDGGAQFKFIPTTLHGGGMIAALADSPLVAGDTYALQIKCDDDQFGQGCEVGEGRWIMVDPDNARSDADSLGATGYYRPEDLHIDPTYPGPGVRFCWANTGNKGAHNWGEVICGVEPDPTDPASAPVVNRFIAGDTQLNAPDNLAFQPGTGILYVIEDNSHGDIWACLPDGDDRDIKSDGCVRMLSVVDPTAEPTGFEFSADGRTAYVSIQHTADGNFDLVDDYATDDILAITGFAASDMGAVNSFGEDTEDDLHDDAADLFGFDDAADSSDLDQSRLATITDAGGADTPAEGDTGYGEDASALLNLAPGLSATFLTRTAAHHMDMGGLWPYGSMDPTHAIYCIESGDEVLDGGATPPKLNPSVQIVDLGDGTVHTIMRGMARCDGARVTPWGTVVATEETGDGSVYEILDPMAILSDADEVYTITSRGGPGEAATIVDGANADASDRAVKRTALPAMSWEGLMVLSSGVIVGGDELRPGSYEFSDVPGDIDTDGGAIFKFIPATLATPDMGIASLDESPLVAGDVYAFQASCRDDNQQYGQGCEVGNGVWVPVVAADAREDAYRQGATGYYRPEDLHLDPVYGGEGVRFCWANTGNSSVGNYGEVMCAVDVAPETAPSDERTVWVTRVFEGDGDFSAPDNFEFQPFSGNHYVIEDRSNGDIWACVPDGSDRDVVDDGCIRLLALHDPSAEPTGFMFLPDGQSAIFIIQHSGGSDATTMLDDYDTDDVLLISGFADPRTLQNDFGAGVDLRLAEESLALFGFRAPLMSSADL